MLWEGIALEALSGDRKAQTPGKGFSFPVAYYVGMGVEGWRGWRGWRATAIGQVLKECVFSWGGRSPVNT